MALRQFTQLSELIRVTIDLRPITPGKFLPPCRLVAKPFSQVCAWREVFEPEIDGGVCFLNAARPKPVDQNPATICSGRSLIGALQLDVTGGDPGHSRSNSIFRQASLFRGFYRPINVEQISVWFNPVFTEDPKLRRSEHPGVSGRSRLTAARRWKMPAGGQLGISSLPTAWQADGAVERTRTSTPFPALPPQGSASTNSATTAGQLF